MACCFARLDPRLVSVEAAPHAARVSTSPPPRLSCAGWRVVGGTLAYPVVPPESAEDTDWELTDLPDADRPAAGDREPPQQQPAGGANGASAAATAGVGPARAARVTLRKKTPSEHLLVWWRRVFEGDPEIDVAAIRGRERYAQRTAGARRAWEDAEAQFKECVCVPCALGFLSRAGRVLRLFAGGCSGRCSARLAVSFLVSCEAESTAEVSCCSACGGARPLRRMVARRQAVEIDLEDEDEEAGGPGGSGGAGMEVEEGG